MKRTKKIIIALVASACTILVLFIAAALILSTLLERTSFGNKVRQEVSSLVGGDFNFDSIALAVFPSPHAVLINPQLNIQKRFSAAAEKVEIYPDIYTSLTGHAAVKKVAVRHPEATIWMSESLGSPKKHPLQLDNNEILPSLLKTLSWLPNIFLSIDHGTVSQGSIKLIYNQTALVTFNSLDASIENVSDSVAIKATTASNIFKNLTVTGTIHPRQFEGSTHIEISKLDLGAINNIISADSSLRIESGLADLDLSLTVHNKERIDLGFNGSAPHIRIAEEGQKADIEVLTLAGMANVSPASTNVTLSDLHLGNPAMRVSGSAIISEGTPKLSLKLQGRNIDVNSTRAASLALTGSNHVAQTIFEILPDGTIPSLTILGQADTFPGLADLDNLELQASLSKGKVHIPGANLALADVSGVVDMKKGILAGENVLAQWHNSMLKKGKFRIDLLKDPLPLTVGTGIDIDVADIPTILEKFIEDKTSNNKLALIEDLSGSATGALSLTGDTGRINIAASATDINISARHRDIPYPLKITDGGISYDKSQIQLERVVGSVGTSTFDSLSGTISLGETKTFAITSGASRIVLKDMMPWLSSHKATRKIATYYGGGESILQLTKIQAGGSLQDFRQAHFNLAGDIHDLTLQNLPNQPGPIDIASLQFKTDRETLFFSDVQAGMLDGSVTMSGTYPYSKSDNQRNISLSFEGRMGKQLIGWMTDSVSPPPWLQLRPLSIRKSDLRYSNQGQHNISATLALQDDLEVSTEMSLSADTVIVDSLKVKDHLSEASVTARKRGKHIDFSFDGALHSATLDQLAQIPSLQSGLIEGKANVSLDLENPFGFIFLGDMSGKQVSVLTTPEVPLVVKNMSVKGVPGSISIASSNLSWNGTALTVSGNLRPRAGALPKFTLDVEADSLDVDTIMKKIPSLSKTQDKKTPPAAFFSALEGSVRFKTNTLKVHGYTIQSLQADIRLHENAADVTLKELILCGIPVKGTATLAGQNFTFHLEPEAHAQKLSTTLECLAGRQFKADGLLDFTGVFDGHGTLQDLARSTTGSMEISVSDGHIYHDIIMLNVLKFLNASQVLTGQVTADRMLEKGLGFNRFQAGIKLDNGKLLCEKFILDGEEIKLGGTGEIDSFEKRLDLTLLVAPLKTSSALLDHVPLIGGILQTIDTIPLGVKGTFKDLHFLPLAPSAVKDELQDVMKDTLGIPLKLVHLDVFNTKEKRGEM